MATQDHRATRRTAAQQERVERLGSNPARRKKGGSTTGSGMRKSSTKNGGTRPRKNSKY